MSRPVSMTTSRRVRVIGPWPKRKQFRASRYGAKQAFVLLKVRQGKRQSIGYAYLLPLGRIFLGNPIIPGCPILGRIRPGSGTIRPSIEVYGLVNE